MNKLLTLFFMFYSGLIFSQDLNVMSYNIRYGTSQDGENSWDFRKEKVVDLLNYYEASFIGLQEVQKFQLDYILEKMPTYDFIGLPRENEDLAEYSCILYNKNLFQLKEQKTIWLSKTPDTISKGWDAVCHRIVTYGLFECLKTKKEFWIANTHFDHEGKTARLESAKMIVELSKELKNKSNIPFILTGDFNATPKDDCIETLKKDLFEASSNSLSKPYGDLATWNAFDFKTKPSRQIDFIFFDKFSKIKVKKFKTISDFYNFKYPSDHFSILATFILD